MAKQDSFQALGTSGNSQWGRLNYVDPDAQFRGTAAIRLYDEMRYTDPTGTMMYQALALPIRQVRWWCEAGGAKTAADSAAAEFVWECLNDMTHPWSATLENVCSMFAYGWAWLEQVLQRRPDGRVGWERIALRPQRSLYDWVFAPDGDIKGMVQMLVDGGLVEIPLARSLLFRTVTEGDIPEGISIYRAAARAYQYKRRLERVEGIGLYRRWAGFPQLELPLDASTRAQLGEDSDEAKAEATLKAIYDDRMLGFYAPAGWKLELGGPAGTVDATMSETIMRKDQEMARAILGQFLLVGLKNVGTQALAETLSDIFTLAVEAYLADIAGEFNRYAIPYLLRYNPDLAAPLTGLPQLRYASPRRLDLGAVGDFISKLAGVDLLSRNRDTEAFLRGLLPGMPEPPEADGAGAPARPTAKPEATAPPRDAAQHTVGRGERFTLVGAASPATQYRQLAEANAAAQVANLQAWTEQSATELASLPATTTESELRAKLDDLVLVGLLLFREKSVLDIGAAFWLAFGKPSGGPSELQELGREVAEADRWLGYAEPGTLVRVNPAGKPTLFGDIAGELEGQVAAILLLLKQGQTDEVWWRIKDAVRAVTQGFARARHYAGHIWHAFWRGGAARLGPQGRNNIPVRWVLDPLAHHCRQCPGFAREYPGYNTLLAYTGGILPGQGTDCDGECRCHLEVQTAGGWQWL